MSDTLQEPPSLEGDELGVMIEAVDRGVDWQFSRDVVAAAINTRRRQHDDLIGRRGIGLFYGTKSAFQGLTQRRDRIAYVERFLTDGSDAKTVYGELKQRGCIGWTLFECTRLAFATVGRPEEYEEVRATTARSQYRVTEMMKALRSNAGFEIVQIGDDHGQDFSRMRDTWLGGVEQWVENPTDETFDDLTRETFLVGATGGGRHAFAVAGGDVIESHWDKGPESMDLLSAMPIRDFVARRSRMDEPVWFARAPSMTALPLS